jgi:hypothetical protein
MKKLLLIALASLPLSANADHLDVIQLQLKEGCSVEQYLGIVKDFNEQWAKDHGYRAEVAVPLQSRDLASIFWLGRSADAATFGKAWDVWRDAQSDSKSLPAKLQERFDKCTEGNQARRGYDVY